MESGKWIAALSRKWKPETPNTKLEIPNTKLETMPRPIQAHINQNALESNLRVARRAAPSARIMAVIKAEGYGHGLTRVAEALSAADGFALLDIQDAVRLRENGFRQTILLLEGAFNAEDLALVAGHDLACVIHSAWQIALLDAYPGKSSLDVWLKVNSGMNRLGFTPQQAAQAMEQLCRHRAVRSITVQELRAGAEVGYGALFRAEHPMRIGIVACGYADGYPRQSGRVEPEAPGTHRPTPGGGAPNGPPVLVDGQGA